MCAKLPAPIPAFPQRGRGNTAKCKCQPAGCWFSSLPRWGRAGWGLVVKHIGLNRTHFAQLKATFASVDKAGERYLFNIGGNKYRLVAAIAFKPAPVWVKAVLTHTDDDIGDWK